MGILHGVSRAAREKFPAALFGGHSRVTVGHLVAPMRQTHRLLEGVHDRQGAVLVASRSCALGLDWAGARLVCTSWKRGWRRRASGPGVAPFVPGMCGQTLACRPGARAYFLAPGSVFARRCLRRQICAQEGRIPGLGCLPKGQGEWWEVGVGGYAWRNGRAEGDRPVALTCG